MRPRDCFALDWLPVTRVSLLVHKTLVGHSPSDVLTPAPAADVPGRPVYFEHQVTATSLCHREEHAWSSSLNPNRLTISCWCLLATKADKESQDNTRNTTRNRQRQTEQREQSILRQEIGPYKVKVEANYRDLHSIGPRVHNWRRLLILNRLCTVVVARRDGRAGPSRCSRHISETVPHGCLVATVRLRLYAFCNPVTLT